MLRTGLLLATGALFALSCGEGGGDDGAAAAGGGSGAGGSGGGAGLPAGSRIVAATAPPAAGECRSSAECAGDGTPACAQVADGYRVCTFQAPVVSQASSSNADECDVNRPCATGSCYRVLSFPAGQCGAGGAVYRNQCRSDTCASDADCPGGVCGPRGFTSEERVSGGAIRQCLKADCTSDVDCTAQAGGICALVQGGCAEPSQGDPGGFFPAQLACVYSTGCTSFSNCPRNPPSICRVVDGVGVCVSQQ